MSKDTQKVGLSLSKPSKEKLSKQLDDRSRYARGLLTRLKNMQKQIESAKAVARIEFERRELPHSDWGLRLLDVIKVIEKQFKKIQ